MIRSFLFFYRFFGRPNQDYQWLETDREALAAFLESKTGRKLQVAMRSHEARANANAVQRPNAMEFRCGFASGIRAGLAWLLSLSAIAPPIQEGNESIDLSPLTEEELVARNSA